jgi:hypothetical protein
MLGAVGPVNGVRVCFFFDRVRVEFTAMLVRLVLVYEFRVFFLGLDRV